MTLVVGKLPLKNVGRGILGSGYEPAQHALRFRELLLGPVPADAG